MQSTVFIASSLWLISLVYIPLNAAPSINIKTNYYSVFGNDSNSLHRSLNNSGPVGKNGKRYHALTQWKVEWSYRWLETGSMCKLTQTEVQLEIEYLLPELKQTTPGSKIFSDNWDKYFLALFRHEQQHKDYGVQAATELDKELAAIDPIKNCTELDSQIAKTAQKILEKYERIEKEFDRVTNHGLNQGIKLP